MKYNPNRHYLHPVARPHADDYPDSHFSTRLEVKHFSNDVVVKIEYIIDDDIINGKINSSQASCVAMLYCRDTMYRNGITNTQDDNYFKLYETIPLRVLKNWVEIHPAIVAKTDIEMFSTQTAHPEYKGLPIRIEKGTPLAVDNTWHFEVNAKKYQTHSFFNLIADNDLRSDEFDVQIDIHRPYVDIIADETTIEAFRSLRSNRNITFPSVFLSALITVLSEFKERNFENEGDVPESVPSEGWYRCIYKKLHENGIELGYDDREGNYSIMRAAQLLLTGDSYLRPFGRLFKLDLEE